MSVTLLVVDDDPSVRRLLQLIADDDVRFARCETAASTEAAQQVAASTPPDVVLLDADLRGQDGLALIPSLKRAVPGVAIAVFSSSPYASPAVAERAGADAFVPKGTDLDELLDVLVELARADRPTVIELP